MKPHDCPHYDGHCQHSDRDGRDHCVLDDPRTDVCVLLRKERRKEHYAAGQPRTMNARHLRARELAGLTPRAPNTLLGQQTQRAAKASRPELAPAPKANPFDALLKGTK